MHHISANLAYDRREKNIRGLTKKRYKRVDKNSVDLFLLDTLVLMGALSP